ncbi:MAG: hypothetical protein WD208_00685 [Dehalococcoidia bacterium]
MAGEDARLKAGLKTVEDELNLIKNQVQQTLLDIREHILDVTNPFTDVESGLAQDDQSVLGSASDLIGSSSAVSPSAASAPVEDEVLGQEPDEDSGTEESEESLESDDAGDYEDEFAEIPDDDVFGGGMGNDPGMSDLMGPEEILEEDQPEEDFEFDDTEEEAGGQQDLEDQQAVADAPSAAGKPAAAAVEAEMDLVTLAGLVRWVSVTSRRLGRHRMDILLDTYEMAGRISPRVKGIIRTLCSLGDEDPDGEVPVRDIVASMVRMEGVLSVNGTSDSNRLLGLLLDLDEDPLDRLTLG